MDTNQFKFLMYRSADGDVSVNAIIKDETIWLTQKAMAELFGELDEKLVVSKMEITTPLFLFKNL